jgi:DNA-binding NarL/FixJ family response regulator
VGAGSVLADAYPVLGLALADLLAQAGRPVVATTRTAQETVSAVRATRPALVVVDVAIPFVVPAVRAILSAPGAPDVLLVADAESEALVVAAVVAGAAGCVSRDIGGDGFLRAVAALEAGESVVPRAVVPRVLAVLRSEVAAAQAPAAEADEPLTGRERQVLAMVQAGLTATEIARRLVIAPVTVRTHICAIRRKLGETALPGPYTLVS